MPPSWERQFGERLAPIYEQAKAYGYLFWWCAQYGFRLKIAPVFAYLITIVALIEVAATPIHHALEMIESPLLKLAIIAVLILAALIMTYHHHRLGVRVKRHQVLLTSFRRMAIEGAEKLASAKNGISSDGFYERALEALTFSLAQFNHDGPTFDAAILRLSDDGKSFEMYCQYPIGKFVMPTGGLPRDKSAAGKVLEEKDQLSIVYLPRTSVVHGICLRVGGVAMELPRYTNFRVVDWAFKCLDEKREYRPISLACIQLPTGNSRGTEYVLCLGADRPNCMGELDFHALQVTASIISMALSKESTSLAKPSDKE